MHISVWVLYFTFKIYLQEGWEHGTLNVSQLFTNLSCYLTSHPPPPNPSSRQSLSGRSVALGSVDPDRECWGQAFSSGLLGRAWNYGEFWRKTQHIYDPGENTAIRNLWDSKRTSSALPQSIPGRISLSCSLGASAMNWYLPAVTGLAPQAETSLWFTSHRNEHHMSPEPSD